MSFVSLGRFTQRFVDGIDEPGDPGSCWCPPDGVTALIDLVPPGQDADPSVNFAIMLSDAPLDSNDVLYTFGFGNFTEMQLDGAGQDAWETITGFRPTQGTIANAIAQHLLNPNGANGLDFARPLTAGFNRGLEIYLGGEVWSHTLTGLSDPYSLPVLRVEAEGLAEIYRTQGETQYRLAMGALRKKYATRPIKELIAILFPSGRDDLPLMDELEPQTVKTENWTGGTADNTWVGLSGTWNITSGQVSHASSGDDYYRLDYAFGGSDRMATAVFISSLYGRGVIGRGDSTGANHYMAYGYAANKARIFKRVSSSYTSLYTAGVAYTANDVAGIRSVGSNHKIYRNGSDISSGGVTDTAVSTGLYTLLNGFESGATFGQVIADDLISASGGPFPFFTSRRMRGGLVGMNGGL